MKQLVFLTLIALAKAKVLLDRNCDGVVIGNINHEQEVLKMNLDSPYQLAIDYDTNNLFFSYSANTDEVFKSGYINLKNNEFGNISGIEGGFANTVDDRSHTVYLGGRDGIYKYDFNTKKAIDLRITSKNIWQLYYHDELYFTSYPDEEVFVYRGGKVSRLPELNGIKATLVAVDRNQNIFFANSSGLFCHQSKSSNIINIGDYNLNAITSDNNGNLYFATTNNLYFINDRLRQVEELASLDEIYGMAIEGDGNIIYASGDSLIRLKPTGHRCASTMTVAAYADDLTLEQ